jgi:hypothetical protein
MEETMIDDLEKACEEFAKTYIYIDIPNADATEFLNTIAAIIKKGGSFKDIWELCGRIQRPLWE